LTQYHFLFIAAIMIFIDIIFNIYTKKTFLHSIRNAIISLIAVICAYFTFPAMLRHLLTGQHGLQTIEEGRVMAEQKGFVDGFIGFFNFLNKDIFGYSLIVIIPLIILLVIIKKINNKSNKSNLFSINEKYFICINLFTSFIFIIILSATTKFNAIRYLFPIYPLLFLIVYFLLNYFVKNQKGLIKYFAIISAILISILSLIHEPYYLYRRDKQYLEYFESNSNIPVVMVFDKKSITRTVNTFSMIKNNDKVMIIEKDHLQFLQDEYLIDKPYYLFIINFVDVNNVFNYIKNIRKDYKEPQHIYMDQYLSCFYIS
ncbi:MAG: hypothetical protein Q4F88_06370, partial [Eubacteriales bacterium]|nr:hypothetical protein [Eubacteriales bacterium]